MALILPNYVVLRSRDDDYLGYLRDGGETDGYLNFMETQSVSPYAKFHLEPSDKDDGLVHIRSCENNKYWTRTKNPSISDGKPDEEYWITATAKDKEEDKSKDSCTLFEFISVDSASDAIRITHVNSGCYLAVWPSSDPTRCVLANYKVKDDQSFDIFTMIDWNSLVILPRYVAFKGDNGKYLRNFSIGLPSPFLHEYLLFDYEDIGDKTVPCEIIPTNDGNICIKQISSNKFWRLFPDSLLISPDSDDGSSEDTFFRPFKIDDMTIGLSCLKNNTFCGRLNAEGGTDTFEAGAPSIIKEARLTVEEAVMRREIYGFRYDVDNARIYDESVLSLTQASDKNGDNQTNPLVLKLNYTDIKTRAWNSSFSLTLGVKASMEVEVPFISDVGIEISTEIQTGFEWGETEQTSMELEVEHTVQAPPMTKVTTSLLATVGKCDVPLSYTQEDTLYNGTVVKTKIIGAYFTGSNYYNFSFVDEHEPLPNPPSKIV